MSITFNATKDGVTKSLTFSNVLMPNDNVLLTAELEAALNDYGENSPSSKRLGA